MAKKVKLNEVVKPNVQKVIVEDAKSNVVEVISKEDMAKKKIDPSSTRIIPYQKDLIDGAALVAEEYFIQEFPLMLKFFEGRGVEPVVEYDFETPGEYWMQVNFPLPKVGYFKNNGKREKYIFPNTTEPLVIVLNGYPDLPPIGFFIERNSPNLEVFKEVFKDHLMENAHFVSERVKEFFEEHWYWICFHYENNNWNFDRNDIASGDNLTNYLYAIFYKLVGLEGVSHE